MINVLHTPVSSPLPADPVLRGVSLQILLHELGHPVERLLRALGLVVLQRPGLVGEGVAGRVRVKLELHSRRRQLLAQRLVLLRRGKPAQGRNVSRLPVDQQGRAEFC